MSVDGRDLIDALPAALAPQARLLRRLLDAVEPDERFRALELYGSLARGNADADSDVDVRLWVADERWGGDGGRRRDAPARPRRQP